MFVQYKNILATGARQAAVRRRPDRQSVPQRDHAGQLHLPRHRVRADGDRVFRHARTTAPAAFEAWLEAMQGWVELIGLNPRARSRARARQGRALALLEPHHRLRIPDFPGRWAGKSSTGSPTEPISISRQHQEFSGEDLTLFRSGRPERRYLPHVIEPTFGVDRTFLVAAARCLRRGRDGRRQWQAGHAHRAAARPDAWRRTRRRCCRLMKKPELAERRTRALRAACSGDRVSRRLRRNRQYRQALPSAG